MQAAGTASARDGLPTLEDILREGGTVQQEGCCPDFVRQVPLTPMDAEEAADTLAAFDRNAHDHRHAGHQRSRLLHRLASGASIRVGVFGGSLPMGHKCDRGPHEGHVGAGAPLGDWSPQVKAFPPGVAHETEASLRSARPTKVTEGNQGCAYSARFAKWLGTAFPGANHTVVNFARGGTTTGTQSSYLNGFLDLLQKGDGRDNRDAELDTPIDLALIDFSMNDGTFLEHDIFRDFTESPRRGLDLADLKHASQVQRILETHEGFFRVLHRRSGGRVAMVLMNMMDPSPWYTGLLRPLLARYNVSVLSDLDVSRGQGEVEAQGGGRWSDMSGAARSKVADTYSEWAGHPSWRGHQLIARLLGLNLLHEWRSWTTLGLTAAGFDAAAASSPPPPVFCTAGACPGDTRAATHYALGVTTAGRDVIFGDEDRGVHLPEGWTFDTDLPGKAYGTLAYNASVSTLALPFNYYAGTVTLEFLKSYANIGDLVAWVQPPGTQPRVADCADAQGLAAIRVDTSTSNGRGRDTTTTSGVSPPPAAAPDVLAVWRGSSYWPNHFSLATAVDIFASLPPMPMPVPVAAAHPEVPEDPPPPPPGGGDNGTLDAVHVVPAAAEEVPCVNRTATGGCRAVLFICPVLNQHTGSAKVKLFDLHVT